MSVRRSLMVLIILLIATPIVVFVRSQNRANGSNAEQLKTLQLYRVGTGEVELSVSAIGTLAADQETDLSFLVTGRVSDIYVQRDDYVLAGDTVARIDSTSQQLAYDQAILTLDQAEMTMNDLMVVDDDQIALAQAAVDSARGAYYSIGNSVQPADISAAQLAYDQALRTNNEAILARDTAPPGQYDILAAQAGEASFNLEIARLQLEQLTTGSATSAQSGAAYARVLQAEQELERVKAGPLQVQIDAAQAQIDRAKSQLTQAELSLSRTVLIAPYDGVIGTLNAEVGSLVAPSVPVVTLVDITPLRLAVEVDEVDIRLIEVGLPVRVRLDALPDNVINATVTRISDAGTVSGGIVTYKVEIELSGEDNRARVGMTADATIVIDQATDALFVPNSYIRLDRFTNEAFVNVLQEDNTVREVQVTLGLQGQENSEVRAGIAEGELVVITLGGGGLNEVLGN